MVIQRTNRNFETRSADACFEAMARHARAGRPVMAASAIHQPPSQTDASALPRGDILYGAYAIAAFIFGDEEPGRSRRRVFNLWAHYRDRDEKAGFFKLKGALCLSKSQWRGFHGLG